MTAMDEKTLLITVQEFFPELRIMPQDLRNPTPEFAINFYKHVLRDLEIDLQLFQMPQSNQLQVFSNLEMYQELIPSLNLSKAIQYIFTQIGLGRMHFGLNDLLAPTPKRNLTLMSHFMNFVLFCDSQAAEFDPKFKEFTEFKMRYQEAMKMRDELKKKINQQATERVHRLQMKQELQAQKDAAEKVVNEMAIDFEESKSLQKQTKSRLKIEEQALEKATYHVKTLENELETLRSQIVSSPEEFKDQYDKLVEQRNEAKEKADNLLQQIEPKKQTHEKLSFHIESQETRMAMLSDILELNQAVQSLKLEISALKKEKSSAEEGAENVHEQLKTLHKKLEQTTETLTKLQAQWNQQQCILNSTQETLKMEFDEVKGKFDESSEKQKKVQQAIDDAVSELKDLEMKFNDVVATGVTIKKIWTDVEDHKFNNALERIKEMENLVKQL